MSTPVVMPQMGESIAEGTIVRWIKKVGDAVDRDEPLFEISTDKVDAEIPVAGGRRADRDPVTEGETVPVEQRRGRDWRSGAPSGRRMQRRDAAPAHRAGRPRRGTRRRRCRPASRARRDCDAAPAAAAAAGTDATTR